MAIEAGSGHGPPTNRRHLSFVLDWVEMVCAENNYHRNTADENVRPNCKEK